MPLMKQVLPETGMFACDGEESDPDRISDLPDELLLLVMYFRTLNLWASLMWLYTDVAWFSSMGTFKNFVDNLVMYRSFLPDPVPLDAFWISAICNNSDDSLEYSDIHIHPWIRHALDSNAWALGILKHFGPKPLSMETMENFRPSHSPRCT
jgi:hypothetical protein